MVDATWPPESFQQHGDWLHRHAPDGGSRVNCASALGGAPDISGAGPLVMIRPGEEDLAARLSRAEYVVKDPCRLLVAPTHGLAEVLPAGPRTIVGEGPIARMEEIWAAGGIGPARLRTMARAACTKAYIAGRVGDRPAGAVYVGAQGSLAMFHALEILTEYRRNGLARDMVAACGHWAKGQGADWLSLIVTEANGPARALYSAMGFEDIGGYHYRIKEDPR